MGKEEGRVALLRGRGIILWGMGILGGGVGKWILGKVVFLGSFFFFFSSQLYTAGPMVVASAFKLINLLASRCLWFSPCFYF